MSQIENAIERNSLLAKKNITLLSFLIYGLIHNLGNVQFVVSPAWLNGLDNFMPVHASELSVQLCRVFVFICNCLLLSDPFCYVDGMSPLYMSKSHSLQL